VLLYGEELGMGDNPEVEGRDAVRVPMQWAPDPGAGFTTADPASLPRPITGGEYGPKHVNVQAQRHDPGSLLNWMERQIRLRKELPELGWGTPRLLDAGDDAVLAFRCDWGDRTIVVVHNFRADERTVDLDLDPGPDGGDRAGDRGDAEAEAEAEAEAGATVTLTDLTGDQAYEPSEGGRALRIGGYGYRWLRLPG
jgi:glycosidase